MIMDIKKDNKRTSRGHREDTPEEFKNLRIEEKTFKDIKRIPKTTDQVREYFLTQNSTADEGQNFWDYQTAKGWKIGREPIKDWKAAARYWIRNGFSKNNSNLTKAQKQTQASYFKWKEDMKNENNGKKILSTSDGVTPITLSKPIV